MLGEGLAAQGEVARAVDAGFDPARTHQLLAHAYLLQGNAHKALVEARRTPDAYAGYAARIAALALAQQGKLPAAQALLANLLSADDGRNAEAWADLARVRQMTGDLAGAAAAAGRALAIEPRLTRALLIRAALLRDQYGLVAATPWYEAALKVDPGNADALIGYAATLGDSGRYRDMLAATRRALAARPNSAEALYLQAVLAARADHYDLARALLARIGGGFAHQPGPLLLAGMLDYAAGDDEQAIAMFRQVIGQQPLNIPTRRLLAAALSRSGDWRGALDVLRPIALRGDADSYTLTLVGRSFESLGERDWAARFLDRAGNAALARSTPFGSDDRLDLLQARADAAPGDPIAAVGYIRGLIDAGQQATALGWGQELARRYQGVPQAHLVVGDTLMVMGRAGDAAMAYARAADIRFDESTLLRLVEALDSSRQHDKAAAALALFLSQNPQNIAARRLAAHGQMQAGDWDAAIDTLEGLRARIGNRDAALLAELATAYAGNDDLDTAQRYAVAAYALAPLNPAVVDAYGWVLYQAGDNDPAQQLLEKAVALAPAHPGLRWHLAQVQAELGRADAAHDNIRTVLANPDFADRAAALAVLKTLG
jgi:tetratricopeptide (TPR) repeat protein